MMVSYAPCPYPLETWNKYMMSLYAVPQTNKIKKIKIKKGGGVKQCQQSQRYGKIV